MSTAQWFTEADLPYGKPGINIQVEVSKTLYDKKSEWGHLQVLDTPFYGKLLAIDGIIQVTESEEFIYHEMMVVLPALEHGEAERILIIGGGDGGALRQSVRLGGLGKATQVEIDDMVTNVCRKYIPNISGGALDDQRVELVYQDGAKYVQDTDEKFDVVVLDLTDPLPGGPAEPLFGPEFIARIRSILSPRGVLAMQCGSLVFQPDEVKTQVERLQQVFPHVRLHHAVVPSYQLTSFGFLLASNQPLEPLGRQELERRMAKVTGDNQYLSADMYYASQVLPPYMEAQVLPDSGAARPVTNLTKSDG